MLFSAAVLVALILAVPFGMIMQEPLSATISTFIGAVFFTLYVVFAFKRKKIRSAKIFISIILIFIFLPAMFFTNGGVEGGPNYMEFALMRLDGETWKSGDASDCSLLVDRRNFDGWDVWKKANKRGYECIIRFERDGNKIVAFTENAGIFVKSTTEVKVDVDDIYVALSGDQVALTNIRVTR